MVGGRQGERKRWREGERYDLMASIIKLQDSGSGCLDPGLAGFGDLVCAPPGNLFEVHSAN